MTKDTLSDAVLSIGPAARAGYPRASSSRLIRAGPPTLSPCSINSIPLLPVSSPFLAFYLDFRATEMTILEIISDYCTTETPGSIF